MPGDDKDDKRAESIRKSRRVLMKRAQDIKGLADRGQGRQARKLVEETGYPWGKLGEKQEAGCILSAKILAGMGSNFHNAQGPHLTPGARAGRKPQAARAVRTATVANRAALDAETARGAMVLVED